jgi:hypothetical protein
MYAEQGWKMRTGRGSDRVLVAEKADSALYGSGEVELAELLRWRTEAMEEKTARVRRVKQQKNVNTPTHEGEQDDRHAE